MTALAMPVTNVVELSPAENELRKRGLFHFVESVALCRVGGYSVTVPTFELDGRRKSRLSDVTYNAPPAQPKILLPAKPHNPTYYALPGWKNAARRDGDTVYLSKGLTDSWSYGAGGVKNVIGYFGSELSIPDTLANDLQQFGVKRVVFYPAHDCPKSGENLARALDGTGIIADVRQLPDMAQKDICDLWQAVNFDHVAFQNALHATPRITIVIPTPAPATSATARVSELANFDAIPDALGVKAEYRSNGWCKKPVVCPIASHEHDYKRPAAYWHKDKHILRCFKCGKSHLANDVAAALGVPLAWRGDGVITQPAWTGVRVAASDERRDALPENLAYTLVSKKQTRLARFVDTLLYCGVSLGASYPLQMLASVVGEFYDYSAIWKFVDARTNSLFTTTTVYKIPKGQKWVTIPTLKTLSEFAGVPFFIGSERVPPDALKSNAAYSNHVLAIRHRINIQANKDKYLAAATYAKMLGVSRAKLYQVETAMHDLERTRQFEDVRCEDGSPLSEDDKKQGFYGKVKKDGQWYKRRDKASTRVILPSG